MVLNSRNCAYESPRDELTERLEVQDTAYMQLAIVKTIKGKDHTGVAVDNAILTVHTMAFVEAEQGPRSGQSLVHPLSDPALYCIAGLLWAAQSYI